MSIAAVLFPVFAVGLFVWLLCRGQIGQWAFSTLFFVSVFMAFGIAKLPDIYEVNIAGNTLKALRRETDRAQEALSELKKLRSDMLSMEFKRIPISEFLFTLPEAVKAEEFDQLMFVLDMLPKKEQLDEDLRKDATRACEAVLARQHDITGMHFVFSESGSVQGGGFSRADLFPNEKNFRILTSDEIEAELDELHGKIDNTPGQSLENDKNRELRLEAVKNYKHLSDVCSALANG